jgi:hypothetical protein
MSRCSSSSAETNVRTAAMAIHLQNLPYCLHHTGSYMHCLQHTKSPHFTLTVLRMISRVNRDCFPVAVGFSNTDCVLCEVGIARPSVRTKTLFWKILRKIVDQFEFSFLSSVAPYCTAWFLPVHSQLCRYDSTVTGQDIYFCFRSTC